MSQWQIQVTIFLSGTDVTLSEYFEESNYQKKWELFLLTKHCVQITGLNVKIILYS